MVKPHGNRGEVVTVPVHGLPPLLCAGMTVAAVPPALKASRWHTVRDATSDGGTGQLVALTGARTIGEAEELVGKTLLARVSELPKDYELSDVDALLGRQVCDRRLGLLGTIVEVLRGPANDVWVVDEGAYGELLLPVIPDVVEGVPANGSIVVDVPAGIVAMPDAVDEARNGEPQGE